MLFLQAGLRDPPVQPHEHPEDGKWLPEPYKPRSGVQEAESSQTETLYSYPQPGMSEAQAAIDSSSPWKDGGWAGSRGAVGAHG